MMNTTSLIRMRSSVTGFRRNISSALVLLLLSTCGASARATDTKPVHSLVPATGGKAAIIPIEGELTDMTVESVRRRMNEAIGDGVGIIVFELNTPGGLVTSSIALADLIKNLPDIKTVAWVNTNAHSGGSIVAVACDEIVMARSSRIGDSQVIMGGPTGAGAVPEELHAKAFTPVLKEFNASATLNGYDRVLCEAFVLPEREVWWVENTKTKERRFVLTKEKRRLLGQSPPSERKAGKSTDDDESSEDREVAEDEPEPMIDEHASNTEWKLVEKYYDPILDADVDAMQPIVPDNQLLEMSAAEAYAYGFSKGIVANEKDLKVRYGITSIIRLNPTWSEGLAYWLTSIYVRGFLLAVIFLAAYVEFHTPGVGVAGLVALIGLAVFVGAPYLTGLANIWEIVLIAIGVALIALEIFVIPGFGIAGISGIILVMFGLLATFVPDEPGRSFPIYVPSMPQTMRFLETGVVTLISSLAASLVGMYIVGKYLPKTSVFRRIVPANPTPSDVLTDDPYRGTARVGDVGEASTVLRPSGKAMFGSILVDVVTRGEMIEPPARIEVIERRGNKVVVREMRTTV